MADEKKSKKTKKAAAGAEETSANPIEETTAPPAAEETAPAPAAEPTPANVESMPAEDAAPVAPPVSETQTKTNNSDSQRLEEKAKKAEDAHAAEVKVRKELEVLNAKLLAEKTALLDSLSGEKGQLQDYQERNAKLTAQKNDLENQLRVSITNEILKKETAKKAIGSVHNLPCQSFMYLCIHTRMYRKHNTYANAVMFII